MNDAKRCPVAEIFNNQESVSFSEEQVQRLHELAARAIPEALHVAKPGSRNCLPSLELVEISLVDDETIAQIHVDFMSIPGATDVITFDHGEIIISVETAQSQAAEYKCDWLKEVALYIIHGFLHLSGYEDATDVSAAEMKVTQEAILEKIW